MSLIKSQMEIYNNITKSCLGGVISSSLLNGKCVRRIFNDLDKGTQKLFIYYLQNRVTKLDAFAFSAYEFLAPDQFISISDVALNKTLKQEFHNIHAHPDSSTIEETLMKLNAEHILRGDNAAIVQILDEVCG